MSNRFYKVFVSSTYEDLKEERQAVFDALLKSNCFPVGMEHFPSSNWRSLDLIKKYIDQCDYFVMVSGGVYGSLVLNEPKKISYVEWEYDYAQGKLPCYPFLIEDVNELRGEKLEKDYPKLLEAFHKKVKGSGRNARFYDSVGQLNAGVLHAFQHAPQDSPRPGWIRGDAATASSSIVGAWKLVKSNAAGWNRSNIIKLFAEREFLWVEIDSTGRRNSICGSYELTSVSSYGLYGYGPQMGGLMICEIPRESNYKSLVGQEQKYTIEVDGNVMVTKGERSTGAYVEEEFHRLDLTSGLTVLA